MSEASYTSGHAPATLEDRAWRLLLATAKRAGLGGADASWLERDGPAYKLGAAAPASVRALLDLYAPLCVAELRPFAIGHLGQSLDGHIATASGDSYYVTGPENVRHLHRLRALADAVVVGAGTIERDDPQLTVRHVYGPNPLRVVLDPEGRLPPTRRVFTDGQAPTLVVRAAETDRAPPPGVEVLPVSRTSLGLDLVAMLTHLRERGVLSVFVEGGGATVSRFLSAGLLDRLHVAIAPLVTGAGRLGLTLPSRRSIAECLRPSHRVFTMGDDVLFDCDLHTAATAPAGNALQRVV